MTKEKILEFGLSVFNNENEKFERWLKGVNISLGGVTPESLLETTKGLGLVEKCLNRIEYGSFT